MSTFPQRVDGINLLSRLGSPSALSKMSSHSFLFGQSHCSTDSTDSSTPDAWASGVVAMPLKPNVIVSMLEASIQNTFQNLHQFNVEQDQHKEIETTHKSEFSSVNF